MNNRYLFITFVGTSIFVMLSLIFLPVIFGKRVLTEKERTILEPIYNDSVKLDKVRVNFGGPLRLVYPGITLGNTISFPKHAYDENDLKDQALLVHEACHIWQYQNFGLGYIPRSLFETVTQRDAYVVHFDETKTLRDYDIEEQCEIVAEYFLTSDERHKGYLQEIQKIR